MEAKALKTLASSLCCALLAGCFTVSQTEYPSVADVKAPENAGAIALSGFEATVTSYVPIYGYATVWRSDPGYYRHGRYHYGRSYPETVSTTTYLPQTDITTAYAEKAQDAFESAGFIVGASNATHIVDVKFSGPAVTDGDRFAEFATLVLTLLTADRTDEVWSARMKITDSASGKVVFSRVYEQDYSAVSWGLVPLFGPLSADAVQSSYSKNWCLSALTDRAVADATAFLAAGGDGQR